MSAQVIQKKQVIPSSHFAHSLSGSLQGSQNIIITNTVKEPTTISINIPKDSTSSSNSNNPAPSAGPSAGPLTIPKKISIEIKPHTNIESMDLISEKSYLGNKDIKDTYQTKDFRTQIRDLPDSYIGSIEPATEEMWVPGLDEDGNWKIFKENITYIEGFHTIFNEVITNALDHNSRLKQLIRDKVAGYEAINHLVKNIYVNIDKDTSGRITIKNDGMGIDISKHPENDNIYVPELIFGNLLSSVNYDKTQEKEVAGKNGVGVKLTNIFSTEFQVETVDSIRKLKYMQKWSNAMLNKTAPEITRYTGKPYTTVSYLPDFERFNIKDFTKIDDWKLIHRRIIDAAACAGKEINIWYNDVKVPVHSFESYANMFLAKGTRKVHITPNDRWEVIICLSPENGKFEHVSYVNSIYTDRGGKHVTHVTDNLSKKLADYINAKAKKGSVQMTTTAIKNNIMVFIKCVIINPKFDTQTKRFLTTLVPNFGSRCDIDDTTIEKVSKIGIIERAKHLVEFNAKQQSGANALLVKKGQKIYDPKYHPAGYIDKFPHKCTLVLTEGDSAATFISRGIKELSDENQKYWGWFPLRGKPLNVREASSISVTSNVELKKVANFVGLVVGKKYETKEELSSLNYGHIMILSDADDDGYHIKGLILNYIHFYWPTLIMNGFICTLATAMYKAYIPSKNGGQSVPRTALKFYTTKSFNEWKEKVQSDLHKYEIKYYKGLASNEAQECMEYFSVNMMGKNLINFLWDHQELTEEPWKQLNKANSNMTVESSSEPLVLVKPVIKLKMPTSDNTNINTSNIVPVVPTETSQLTNKDKGKKINATDYHIKLAFSKGYEDSRKRWIDDYSQNKEGKIDIGYDNTQEKVTDFINNRLVVFSFESVKRSVPHILDGLKPSNRKILYAVIKKNCRKPLKVAQLAGYIGEHASYHHGEKSLNDAIVKMAQNYVGKNNINLLYPNGQFGSRMLNGKDAGHPRYINTCLSNITHVIFDKSDTPLYQYLYDDGKKIEPAFYLPIIPMILVNGTDGIGTGYSSQLPCYNPEDIVNNLIAKLNNAPMREMIPFYRGFKGKIERLDDKDITTNINTNTESINNEQSTNGIDKVSMCTIKKTNKFLVIGNWSRLDKNRIQITELPVGAKQSKSFTAYKDFLYNLMDEKAGANITKMIKESNDKQVAKLKGGKKAVTTKTAKPKAKAKTKAKKKVKKTKHNDEDGNDDNVDADDQSETENSEMSEDSGKLKGIITSVEIVKETDIDLILNVTFKDGWLDSELSTKTEDYAFEKKLKLAVILTTSNIHLFSVSGQIKKYNSPLEIIDEYFPIRLNYYAKRKAYILNDLNNMNQIASERYRFVSEYIDGKLNLNRKKKVEMEQILTNNNYKKLSTKVTNNADGNDIPETPEITNDDTNMNIIDDEDNDTDKSYKYLLSMPFYSLTTERLERLKKEIDNYTEKINTLSKKSESDLWMEDLSRFKIEYSKFIREWECDTNNILLGKPVKIVPKIQINKTENKQDINNPLSIKTLTNSSAGPLTGSGSLSGSLTGPVKEKLFIKKLAK